jgi:hypothetical protein
MKATLKTAQMGLAAGEVEVVSRGVRSSIVRGAAREISVTVPTADLVFEEPPAPERPLLLVADEHQELLDEPKPKKKKAAKKKAAKKKAAKDADA